MKNFLRFLAVYFIIIGAISIFYFNINNTLVKQLDSAKEELVGVEYLNAVYNLAISVATYQGSVETKDTKENLDASKKELLNNIETIYGLQSRYPKFKDETFNSYLKKIKTFQTDVQTNYQFFDYINHENYRIGDVSKLLFEEDRKTYFLTSLTTHYMPEYLISILITHNIAEEFLHNGSISDYKMSKYIEHNKLMYLSSEEIYNIIKLLRPYKETKKLQDTINSIMKKLSSLPTNRDTINVKKDQKKAKKYLNISHEILKLSYKLNDEHISILKASLKNRKDNLERILYRDTFLVVSTVLLITLMFFYFYRTFSTNLKKDQEIKRINSNMDKMVIFSKTDMEGKITYVSKAFERLSGYSADELIGKTHRVLRHEDTPQSVFKDMWETILKRKVWVGELKNRGKHNNAYWVKMTIIPDFDEDENLIGFSAYREDITDKKEFEQEKIKTQKALEFKSSFLSNMSHEIRTPLNGVIGLTDIILKTDLNEKQRDLISKVQASSNVLLGVINDILDLSKIESGKMTIEKTVFNLKESIGNTTDMLLLKAQEKGIDLDVIYNDMPDDYYIGDSLRISQVLTNLINNAIKFTSHGGVYIYISKKDKDMIRFEIKDTGIGLKPQQMKTLFQEFTQADMSTSRKYGGTGLGLSISKNLVELMGGRIDVVSEYGKGSVFSIEIPLQKTEPPENGDDHIEPGEQRSSIENELNSIENKKILVAEDNKMNQMVVSMLLEDSNIDIDFALDGEIALEKFKQNCYDLILMDIQMPNMNGYEATEAIRKLDPDIPIIALSANVMQEDIQRALKSGVNDNLAKPIDMKTLYKTLLKYFKED